MVPVKPAVGRRKPVVERAAGRHRLLRQAADAIHAIDDPHAVPVEARRLVELVDKPDFDLLAFLEPQERSRHLAIIAPDGGLGGRLGQEAQTALRALRGHGNRPAGRLARPAPAEDQHAGQRLPEKNTAAEAGDWRHEGSSSRMTGNGPQSYQNVSRETFLSDSCG